MCCAWVLGVYSNCFDSGMISGSVEGREVYPGVGGMHFGFEKLEIWGPGECARALLEGSCRYSWMQVVISQSVVENGCLG
jgi:hypothetical protein